MKLYVHWPPSGKYVLAVSGGADSMVLLDLKAGAAGERGYQLIVAHFDHGLRPESYDDLLFVKAAAAHYDLEFAHVTARLKGACEAQARRARHAWLESVRQKHQADAVVTAHHQDDLLETSLLNLARGSGRRGLAPMPEGGRILRPLLGLTRAQLRAYAAAHSLTWREDPTNSDLTNSRNLLRHVILPNATDAWQEHYLELLARLGTLNKQIDQAIGPLLAGARSGPSSYSFPRALVRDLTLPEVAELLHAAALKLHPGAELERRSVEEAALFSKTAGPHRRRPLRKDIYVMVDPRRISVYYIGTSDR